MRRSAKLAVFFSFVAASGLAISQTSTPAPQAPKAPANTTTVAQGQTAAGTAAGGAASGAAPAAAGAVAGGASFGTAFAAVIAVSAAAAAASSSNLNTTTQH